MKKTWMHAAVQSLVFSVMVLMGPVCSGVQDQNASIPKPSEIGQFYALKDGKLTPLFEEKRVSASYTFTHGISIKIKGASSPVDLPASDDIKFAVHLPDKAIRSFSLQLLDQGKDDRKTRVGEAKWVVQYSANEYGDGYFLLTPKIRLAPGQYVFFSSGANTVDNVYTFGIQ